jgi:hypothetical protein
MREVAVQTLEEGTFCRQITHPDRIKKVLSNLKSDGSDRSSLIVWNLFALERWAKVVNIPF